MFNFLKKPKFKNEDEAIVALMRITSMGFGNDKDFEKENMLKVIDGVMGDYAQDSDNPKLFYWLGIAWRNFNAWHIRGDDRKEYLSKAINCFDKALNLSKNVFPVQLPLSKRHNAEYLGQIDIAGDLGVMLVNEALIRDLDRAEKILLFVFNSTREYESCLCSLAELYYKKSDYEKCAEIANIAHDRATKSPEWKSDPPPAPIGIAGKAYRALGKLAKKEKKLEESKSWFRKLKKLGVASENDLKILGKLELK